MHIYRLLRKLTLLYGVLILPLLFRIFRKFSLHFVVLILPLLYSICWKFALLYGFLFPPLFCRICKKISDPWCPRPSSLLQASSKVLSESWCPNTPYPLLANLKTYSENYLLQRCPYPLLSSTVFVKKALHFWCPCPSSPLKASSKIRSNFFVLILSLLWRTFHISLFVLFLFRDHFWPWGSLISRCHKEKIWWLICQNMTITKFLCAQSLCTQSEKFSKIIKLWRLRAKIVCWWQYWQ